MPASVRPAWAYRAGLNAHLAVSPSRSGADIADIADIVGDCACEKHVTWCKGDNRRAQPTMAITTAESTDLGCGSYLGRSFPGF
jgi:hypothetical protein